MPVPETANETNNTAIADSVPEIVNPTMLNTGNPIMVLLIVLLLPLVGYGRRKE